MRLVRRFIRLYQSFIISGAVVVFFLTVLFVGLIPGIQKVVDLFTENVATGKIIKTLQNKQQVLEALDAQQLYTLSAAAVSAIPTDKSLGSIFSTVDVLVSRQGATVTSVSLGQVGSVATDSAKIALKNGVSTVPFSIIVSGSIDQLRNVLDTAVKIRRFFRVTNFDLQIDQKTGESTSTLTMEAYYAPVAKSTATVTDTLTGLSNDEISILNQVTGMPLLTPVSAFGTNDATAVPQTTPSTTNPFAP